MLLIVNIKKKLICSYMILYIYYICRVGYGSPLNLNQLALNSTYFFVDFKRINKMQIFFPYIIKNNITL